MAAPHGDAHLFPLPPIRLPPGTQRVSITSSRQRSRYRHRIASTIIANTSIKALNTLSTSYYAHAHGVTPLKPADRTVVSASPSLHKVPHASSNNQPPPPPPAQALRVTSLQQQRLIDHVYSCARRYHTDSHHRVLPTSNASGSDDNGPLLDRCYYDQSVLDHIGGDIFNTATQKVASSYFKTNNAVPLVASRVALPSRAGEVDLLSALPIDIAAYYASPAACMRHASQPSPLSVSIGAPLPSIVNGNCNVHKSKPIATPGRRVSKPRFYGEHREYLALLRRMHAAGMLTYTTTPKVVVGLFGTPKPSDGTIRLIVDGRAANQVFADPPSVELPTPDLFTKLQVPAGKRLFVAKTDLSDFFFRFRTPSWMHEYFALPPVHAQDIGQSSVYGNGTRIYPCFAVLAMGWSHSVFATQTAHEHLLNTKTTLFPLCDRITRSSDLRVDRMRHAVYVDDMLQFGLVEDELTLAQRQYINAAEREQLPVKASKVTAPSATGVECLGFNVNGTLHTVGVTADKLHQLCIDTEHLIKRRRCTGRQLAEIVGKWTWAMLARRPALSVFNSCYRFIRVADRLLFNIWISVAVELRTAIGMAPLLHTNIAAPFFDRAMAVDASLAGQGVCVARVPSELMASVSMRCGLRGPLGAIERQRASPMHIGHPQAKAAASCDNSAFSTMYNNGAEVHNIFASDGAAAVADSMKRFKASNDTEVFLGSPIGINFANIGNHEPPIAPKSRAYFLESPGEFWTKTVEVDMCRCWRDGGCVPPQPMAVVPYDILILGPSHRVAATCAAAMCKRHSVIKGIAFTNAGGAQSTVLVQGATLYPPWSGVEADDDLYLRPYASTRDQTTANAMSQAKSDTDCASSHARCPRATHIQPPAPPKNSQHRFVEHTSLPHRAHRPPAVPSYADGQGDGFGMLRDRNASFDCNGQSTTYFERPRRDMSRPSVKTMATANDLCESDALGAPDLIFDDEYGALGARRWKFPEHTAPDDGRLMADDGHIDSRNLRSRRGKCVNWAQIDMALKISQRFRLVSTQIQFPSHRLIGAGLLHDPNRFSLCFFLSNKNSSNFVRFICPFNHDSKVLSCTLINCCFFFITNTLVTAVGGVSHSIISTPFRQPSVPHMHGGLTTAGYHPPPSPREVASTMVRPDAMEPGVEALLAAPWTTIVASPWHTEEHINVLELRSLSTAVRWALSHPNTIGNKLLVLSDSQVAVGVMSKGRSSSPPLLRRSRAIAAALLASGLQLFVHWIPSASNPADEPSRRWSRGSGSGGSTISVVGPDTATTGRQSRA